MYDRLNGAAATTWFAQCLAPPVLLVRKLGWDGHGPTGGRTGQGRDYYSRLLLGQVHQVGRADVSRPGDGSHRRQQVRAGHCPGSGRAGERRHSASLPFPSCTRLAAAPASGNHYRAVMDQRKAVRILARLGDAGVQSWVDRGWGFDARPRNADGETLGSRTARESRESRQDEPDCESSRFRGAQGLAAHTIAFRDPAGAEVDLHPVDMRDDGGGEPDPAG
jgi:hypothetical protein